MDSLLAGFADELMKLGAFGQEHVEAESYPAGTVRTVMDTFQNPNNKAGIKSGPVNPPPAARNPAAPTPLTTPSHMTDYASKS